MPLRTYNFEGSPIVAPLTITSDQPVFDSTSVSLKQHRVSLSAQRWQLEFGITTNDNENSMFLSSIVNRDSVRTMVMPQLNTVNRQLELSVTSAPITTLTSVGATSVPVDLGAIGTVNIPKGKFIKFSNHTKIYVTTTNITTDGVVNFNIFPNLTAQLTDSDTILFGESVILSYLADVSNIQGITYRDGLLTQIDRIKIFEAL